MNKLTDETEGEKTAERLDQLIDALSPSPQGGMLSQSLFDAPDLGTWQAHSHTGQWWHEVAPEDRGLHNWGIIDRAEWDGVPPPRWLPTDEMPAWARVG